MEQIKCILCNKDDSRLMVKKNSFNVVRCNICGLVYLNPRLKESELAELYNLSKDSFNDEVANSKLQAGHDAHKIKKFNIAIQLLKKHKNNIKNVFDLGCSTGIFLKMVAEEGWIAYGSDVNRDLVSVNQMKYGDRIKLQVGERIDFPDQYFDTLTMFDSIEHMPDPIANLKEVMRVLKNDGLLVISTPNVDGLFPRLTYNLLGRTIGAWEHPTPPGHVFQFSPDTLKKVLEKAGIKCIDMNDFAIYKLYTEGQLENSIINTLKKSVRKSSHREQIDLVKGGSKSADIHGATFSSHFLKKIPRLFIRGFSRILVEFIYPIARLIKKGDSMVVVARKVY